MKKPQRLKKYILLIALLALFIAPTAAAWIYYHYAPKQTFHSKHHGQLLSIATPTLFKHEKAIHTLLTDKWTLLYPLPHACKSTCRQDLYTLKQLRLALGKEMPRLQLIALINKNNKHHMNRELFAHYSMQILPLDEQQQASLEHELQQQAGQNMADSVLLLDPIGNIVMRYNTPLSAKDIYQDLERLLSVSRIG